jgi:hypothetical protein
MTLSPVDCGNWITNTAAWRPIEAVNASEFRPSGGTPKVQMHQFAAE